MEFDNSISIGDIISILAVVITFLTLWIMKKQREDANRPYLVLHYNNEFDEIFNLKERNLDLLDVQEYRESYTNMYDLNKNPFDFEIKNIGNGVAREIKVKIKVGNIDTIKFSETMYIDKDKDIEDILVVNIQDENEKKLIYTEAIALKGCDLYFSHLENSNSFSLSKKLLHFGCIVNDVLFNYMNNEDFESIVRKLFPNIIVEMEYKSILNKKYKESYSISIHTNSFGQLMSTYQIKLENKKS